MELSVETQSEMEDLMAGGGRQQGAATGTLLADRRMLPELVLGSVNIAGQQLHLALFGNEMHDGSECAMLGAQQVKCLGFRV
jgi:hypothetical protein